jgi:hypothetical protein
MHMDVDSYIMAGSTYITELGAACTYVAKTYLYKCVSRITWEGMRRCDMWQRVHKGSSHINGKGGGGGGRRDTRTGQEVTQHIAPQTWVRVVVTV